MSEPTKVNVAPTIDLTPAGVDKNIYQFAEKLIIGSGEGPRYNDAQFADWRDVHAQDLSVKLQQAYDEYMEEFCH
jgi:hypothetical protein